MSAALTSREPRVAIVHDALVNAGGAERVATFLCEAFPDAPLYTSVYLPDRTFDEFRSRRIHVLPGASRARSEASAKRLLPLWVLGFRHLDLRGYDVVLSSTTFAAKHIQPPDGVRHVSYCYAPFRLLWKPEAYEPTSVPVGAAARAAIELARPMLRAWDRAATNRAAALATTCRNMARAIAECYDREAEIIYAPVRLSEYRIRSGSKDAPGDFYLTVSRLVSHKRVDLAVRACRELGRRLVVVGDGPELEPLRALGGDQVTFTGFVDRPSLVELYANCRALLFCSEEDYGLAPIEAQASGRPVVAYGAGGALETVADGQSGIFFGEQTTDSLIAAILRFERQSFDPVRVRDSVARFDVEPFTRHVRNFVLAAADDRPAERSRDREEQVV
jgi:glycosyltransferase involved in cell wall biosynthesis